MWYQKGLRICICGSSNHHDRNRLTFDCGLIRAASAKREQADNVSETQPIYLNIGCGYAAPEKWTNVDSSPTARLEKLPIVGGILGKLSGNAQRFPDAVRYGNIITGGIFADNSVTAIYASHVLEHLALADMRSALANLYRMLRPDGTIRVIVPDLAARAEAYVVRAKAGDEDAAEAFMRGCYLGRETRGLIGNIRSVFCGSDHLWMWDEASMRRELERAGFVDIRRASFGDSGDPMFAAVEDPTRFIDDGIVEIAFNAKKSA
jgi:SAM-dependent methyltransferase